MSNNPAETTYDRHHPIALSANEYLQYEIGMLRLPARIWNGAVVFGIGEYWGGCKEVTVACPNPGSYSASVLVDLYTDGQRTLKVSDRISGTGSSMEASVRDAMQKYAHNVFRAFQKMHMPASRDPEEELISLDSYSDLTSRQTTWNVFQGGPLMHAEGADEEALLRSIKDQPPLESVKDEVAAALHIDDRLHWVKLFVSRSEHGDTTAECAIDNALSESGCQNLESFLWPPADVPQSLRQFFVLQPAR
jgi:hypothetical protein